MAVKDSKIEVIEIFVEVVPGNGREGGGRFQSMGNIVVRDVKVDGFVGGGVFSG